MIVSKNQLTIFIITILLLVMNFTVGYAEDWSDYSVKISTGPTAGTFEVVGATAASILKNALPGLNVLSIPGPGSGGNPTLVERGKCEIGMATGSTAADAWLKEPPYENEHRDIRAMIALYPNTFQMWALADSDIFEIPDVVGHKYVPGTGTGTGAWTTAKYVLSVYDLTFEDVEEAGGKVIPYNWPDANSGLQDKYLDVVSWTTSFPQPAMLNTSMQRDIRLIPFDKRQQFIDTFPGHVPITIPAGTYNKQEIDIETVASPLFFVVSKDLSKDLVKAMTKALWENRDKLGAAHSLLKYMTEETVGKGMAIPLHPGAIEAYEELGIDYNDPTVPVD